MSRLYELHVYTMGSHDYAVAVARVIDPTGAFFGNRILSRDNSAGPESKHPILGAFRSGSTSPHPPHPGRPTPPHPTPPHPPPPPLHTPTHPTQTHLHPHPDLSLKHLKRLFPVDDSMVAVIDDRGSVWQWCENLVPVAPCTYGSYAHTFDVPSDPDPRREAADNGSDTYFVGAGDIHAPVGAPPVSDVAAPTPADASAAESEEEREEDRRLAALGNGADADGANAADLAVTSGSWRIALEPIGSDVAVVGADAPRPSAGHPSMVPVDRDRELQVVAKVGTLFLPSVLWGVRLNADVCGWVACVRDGTGAGRGAPRVLCERGGPARRRQAGPGRDEARRLQRLGPGV